MVVLVRRTAEPGPMHAHVDALPPVAVGDPVRTEAGAVGLAGSVATPAKEIWYSPAGRTWYAPALPSAGDLSTVAETVRHVLDRTPDLDLSGGAGPAHADRLARTLRSGGLPAAAADLAGRGGGLTPAGDDILAGLFLVSRAVSGPDAGPALAVLARDAASHAISRAYLESSARGRSLAAVHDLFAAGACGRVDLAGLARDRLARIGHTSGLDLAYGVLVGSTLWPDLAMPGRS